MEDNSDLNDVLSEEGAAEEQQIIPTRSQRRTRGSLFFPLLLITVGIVLLLDNLGSLSGSAWDTLLKLWPVLLLAIGLDALLRREGLAAPVFWLGMGVIFLLHNYNLLAWNAWDVLLRVWPVLLIAIGLDLVVGRRSFWGGIFAALLVAAIGAGALWTFGADLARGELRTEVIQQALPDASEARLVFKPVVGSLRLWALEDSNNLVEGSLRRWQGEAIRQDFAEANGKSTFSLVSQGWTPVYPTGPTSQPTWDLGISPQATLELKVEMAVGDLDLNLTGLQLSGFDVEFAIGQVLLRLPQTGQFEGSLSGAIGKIEIRAPESMALQVESNTGLANIQVPPGYTQQNGVYTSPGYASAENRVRLKVDQAIGLVKIRQP